MKHSTKYEGKIGVERCPITEDETMILQDFHYREILEDQEGKKYFINKNDRAIYFRVSPLSPAPVKDDKMEYTLVDISKAFEAGQSYEFWLQTRNALEEKDVPLSHDAYLRSLTPKRMITPVKDELLEMDRRIGGLYIKDNCVASLNMAYMTYTTTGDNIAEAYNGTIAKGYNPAAMDELYNLIQWISRVTNNPEIGIKCDKALQNAKTIQP